MRAILATSVALLFAGAAFAQAPSPAQMGITATSPQSLQTLDSSKTWVPLGTVSGGVFSGMGREINLTSFGAKCDGATIDTTAIQNWLNALATGGRLTAPAGVCLFDAPLVAPFANSYTIQGAGPKSTIFKYVGANTTNDLIVISDTTHGGEAGASIRDFTIQSATTMTGGYALHAHMLFDTEVSNVFLDDRNNPDVSTSGKLCGGYWFDFASNVDLRNPRAFSTQNCGDGLLVNSSTGVASAELRVSGGNIGGYATNNVTTGFISGLHMAGGFGGLRCDGTNIHGNRYGLTVDNAVVAMNNREFDQGVTCAFDSNQNAGIWLNDPLVTSPGAVVDLGGWIAATQQGPGVLISAWKGTVNLHGDMLYFNCGDGVDIEDANAYVLVSPTVQVYANGHNLGSGCAAWQTANSGHGWGLYAGVVNGNAFNWGHYLSNPAGAASPNVIAPSWATTYFAGAGTELKTLAPSLDNIFTLDTVQASRASSLKFENQGVSKWLLTRDNTNNFRILDVANAAAAAFSITTPGVITLGESGGSTNIVGSLKMGGVAGFSGTKTAGTCVLTISNGVITNVTGC